MKSLKESLFDDNITNNLIIDEDFITDYIKQKISNYKKRHLYARGFFPRKEGYPRSNTICSVNLYTHEYDANYKLADPNVSETLNITFEIELAKNKKDIILKPQRGTGGINEAFALHVFRKDKSWGGKKEITGIIFNDIIISPISTTKQVNDFLKFIDSIFEGFENCCKIDKICDWDWRKLKSKENVLMLLDRLREILPNPIAKFIYLNPRYTKMQ